MDANQRQELQELLEKLTHSGSPSLDKNMMKKVKTICRQSDSNVREVYRVIMKNLAKKHAEVRLSAFQLLSELFIRSNQFRELVLADFRKLAALVTGTDPAQPLPLPKDAATQLKRRSLLAIREWNQKFGSGYPELRLGYNYLKFNRKVDFDELVAHSEAERRRREQRDTRRRTILHQRVHEVKQEMEDLKKEVGSCLTEMEACFNLLLPRFDLPDIYQSNDAAEGGTGVSGKGWIRELVTSGNAVGAPPLKKIRVMTSSCCSLTLPGGDRESLDGSEELEEDEENEKEENGDDKEKERKKEKPGVGNEEEEDEQKEEKEDHKRTKDDETADVGSSAEGKVRLSFADKNFTTTEELKEREGIIKVKVASIPGDNVNVEDRDGGGDHCSVPCEDQSREVLEQSVMDPCLELDSDSDSEVEWEDVPPAVGGLAEVLQEHGLATRGLVVPVTLGSRVEVEETEDNSSVLSSLKENRQLLLVHFIPTLNKCLEWMSKAGEEASVRAAIDLKSHIHSALAKYNKLKITSAHDTCEPAKPVMPPQQDAAASGSAPVVTDLEWKFGSDIQEQGLEAELELDPTTPHAQFAKLKQKRKQLVTAMSSGSSVTSSLTTVSQGSKATPPYVNQDHKGRAPVIPFGMDLYHWEDPAKKVEARMLAPIGSLHRFWAEEKEVTISQDEQNRLKCRTISFPGHFQPVVKSCRALLPSGKLCPRKDRYKCPFHGPIVPRDQYGNPVQQLDRGNEKEEVSGEGRDTSFSGEPLWKDREVQEDIMAATGLELQIPTTTKEKGKGKRKATAKYPGLTDLSTLTKNPRQRLENKLLSKRALKRVAQDVDKLAANKFDDKFGNNFNYALKK